MIKTTTGKDEVSPWACMRIVARRLDMEMLNVNIPKEYLQRKSSGRGATVDLGSIDDIVEFNKNNT